ncbi:MAG TPA: ATP-binding protein [Cyclobacteriaceae bacterium]|nr:ATP-binding protein [Cyclobacteriaceae bacterium]
MNQSAKPVVKVLLIEDDEDDAFITQEYLGEIENFSFEVTWQPNLALAKRDMLKGDRDIFLIDYRLGGENGIDLIKFIHDHGVLTPAILLTGQGDMEVDLSASRFGAADYLVKSELDAAILERTIRYALSQAKIIKALDEKEKKYSSLFERSIDPIFLASSNFKLEEANHSFLKLFGFGSDEMGTFSVSTIFDKQEDFQYFKDSLKEKEQIKDFEVTLTTKSGERKICVLNCVFIPDQASDFCCYQGIIHDLSIRKKAEHDMLIAERLSVTGRIARTIAHEVRNPLTNLNLALDQLMSEVPAGNESAKLYGDIIQRNADRIEQLVGEMLNSSKPKEIHLQSFSVGEILDNTLELAMDRINLKQIKLNRNYAGNFPKVLVDLEKIKVAFLNIIINAIEAMPPEMGVLTVAASLRDGVIVIEISDNGKGIPPADARRLFDPFFTGKESGMGLGLTTTKNILNSHNAEVEVESEVGKGTTFYIYFKPPPE